MNTDSGIQIVVVQMALDGTSWAGVGYERGIHTISVVCLSVVWQDCLLYDTMRWDFTHANVVWSGIVDELQTSSIQHVVLQASYGSSTGLVCLVAWRVSCSRNRSIDIDKIT